MNSDGTEPGNSRTGTAAHEKPPINGANGGGIVLGGRYHLGERLGQGGMSTVFQAQDQALGRQVAVKLFRSDIADETELDRQRGEVRVLAGLNHPNLVMVYDAVTDTDSLEARTYLVMELVQGTDLHRVRQREDLGNGDDGMGPSETADLGAGLADALAYIHERGIVHRDVKPANILLGDGTGAQPKGHAKLTDFGIARLVDSARMTATGQSMGTATYFSPEQAQGLTISRASDIYSLGLVLLECLTGKVEFPGPAIASAAARVQRDPEIPSWIGVGWVELLTAMTRRDPIARPSAAEVAAALRTGPRAGALGDAYSLDPDTESLPSTGKTETYPGAGAAGAGGAGAGAAAAGGAYGPPTSQMPSIRPQNSGSNAGAGDGAYAGDSADFDEEHAHRSGSRLFLPDDDDDQGPADVRPSRKKRAGKQDRRTGAAAADGPAGSVPEDKTSGSYGPSGGTGTIGAAAPVDAAGSSERSDAGRGAADRAPRAADRAPRAPRAADRRRRGPSAAQWMIVVFSLAAIAIVAGILVFLSLDTGSAPAPVNYPPVPGELGQHLEDLQESVTP
ncbi:serine/threonine-protein kinase [Arthrobacter pigmenti]